MTTLNNPTSFILAGKAIFTVRNDDTGNRFTYRVKGIEGKNVWFVGVLDGSDNNSCYAYIGTIFGDQFRRTAKSKVSEDSVSFKAFSWIWDKLKVDKLPENVKIYHEGRCGRCGRRLTVPESIESGFGPECINHVMG